MTNRDKEIWTEGHYAGIACVAVMQLAEAGQIGSSNDSFKEAFKLAIRDNDWKMLDDETIDTMYNIWRSERYEKLVEEYCDGEGE